MSAKKASLLIVFLTVFIDLLGFGMVLPLLPIYARQFSIDDSGWTIALLMSSFSIMQFLFAPAWGRLSDRIGRRPVLMVGLAGSTVFYAIFGLATMQQSLFWLFVSRIGAGIAGATISTAHAYIADVTTLETRAKGMALIGAAFGMGFTFGPLIGAAALFNADGGQLSPWPGYLASALSGLALLLAIFKLPESLRPDSHPAERKWLDMGSLKDALSQPSVALLLLTSFVSVFSFANFEVTLSLFLKNEQGYNLPPQQVLLAFAFVGFVLTLAQGFLVRRLATRLPEGTMALMGAGTSLLGFMLMAQSAVQQGMGLLFVAMAVQVVGFAFMTPSINSLISRRSDPARQGGILGLGQSVSSLARIAGPLVAVPLFFQGVQLPYFAGAGLMLLAMVLLVLAVRGGKDFVKESSRPDTR